MVVDFLFHGSPAGNFQALAVLRRAVLGNGADSMLNKPVMLPLKPPAGAPGGTDYTGIKSVNSIIVYEIG